MGLKVGYVDIYRLIHSDKNKDLFINCEFKFT